MLGGGAAMSGNRSRDKGERAELRIAEELRPAFPDARRGLGQARGGKAVADVEGTPLFVQVKANGRLLPALEQAERDSDGRPGLAVVCVDYDRAGSIAAMRLASLVALLSSLRSTITLADTRTRIAREDAGAAQAKADHEERRAEELAARIQEQRAEIESLKEELRHARSYEAIAAEGAAKVVELMDANTRLKEELAHIQLSDGMATCKRVEDDRQRLRAENTRQGRAVERLTLAIDAAAPQLVCGCNHRATCYGAYEGRKVSFGCDKCCGHGNEDGWCEPFPTSDNPSLRQPGGAHE